MADVLSLERSQPKPSPEAARTLGGGQVPLAVDLDGTLVATDLLVESLFILAKRSPATLLRLPLWLLRGRAYFKAALARTVTPDARTLPYNRDVLAYLAEQKRQGRRLLLATGADQAIAHQVSAHLRCFEDVLASDGRTNLSGAAKRDRLVAEFGIGEFDYAGNDNADRSVWQAARRAILVRPGGALLLRVMAAGTPVERVFEGVSGVSYAHALRVNHWFKNFLVFLPLIIHGLLFDPAALKGAAVAFVAFSLCASGIYLVNDLFDLPEDRQHPYKCGRMLASGQLPLAHALLLVPLLLLAASFVAWQLPHGFLAILGTYLVLMLAYALRLRDVAYVDVATLGVGYTLRVLGGATAAGLAAPLWLLSTCFLLFTGLATLKRYADLVVLHRLKGSTARVHAYSAGDGRRLVAVGCGVICAAFVVLADHYFAGGHLRGRHGLIWLAFPLLLYWLAHMWLMASRGRIVGDPFAFALQDRTSLIVGFLSAVTFLLAEA